MKTTNKRIKKQVEPRLKVWLLRGREITHNQAQRMWGTNRLAEFIRRLRRNQGMDIEMKMTNYNGDIYGVYRLKQKPKIDRIASRQYMEQA